MVTSSDTLRRIQKSSARLHIRVADPKVVTQATGISPDDSWRAGEQRRQVGLPAKYGSWRLVEDEADVPETACFSDAVERCLRRLLARIDPAQFRQRLATLDPDLKPVIVLTGFAHDFPNVSIPHDLLQQIADLGAELEEDFYPLPPAEENQTACPA